MKISFYLLVAIAIFSLGCKPKPYQTTAKGLKYKIYKSNGGEKAKLGDMIKFHYVITTSKDSELSNSYKMGKPYLARLSNTVFGSMTEGFEMLGKGDSAAFFVSADSMSKGHPDPALKPGTLIKYTIKILDIKPSAEFEKDRKKAQEEQDKLMNENKAKEPGLIEDYIKTKAPKAKKTDSGLYYFIEKEGKGPKPKNGDSIVAKYKGMFLDGKEFDNDRGKPFVFKLGAQQVIPGWDEGFALLKKGSKATFIIPSKLAYGPRGSGKAIPPYTPLVFEVELIDIK
jgi:FKBP-type peptidyl-prolyl cis-trans isomerase FkpA